MAGNTHKTVGLSAGANIRPLNCSATWCNTRALQSAVFYLLLCLLGHSSGASGQAWQIDVTGAIGPATADHMIRGLKAAQDAGANLIILRIDTPGGLDKSMRSMIKAVLASPIPIVGYVAPGGARAASAGTYLLYATHIAAMAPGTNLGAATPVQLGSPGLPALPDGEETEEKDPAPATGTAMERKLINDAVAYIQSLAQLRQRNAPWAELAVREGASLSAADALEAGVIDLLAGSVTELLQKTDGMTVVIGSNTLVLASRDLSIHQHPIDWRSEFLGTITDPNVAYILMLLGIYGLLFEFYNPGWGAPGVVGAICLLLALFAFQTLPISYAGLALLILGIGLMTAEAFAPSFGVLGLGGIVAFMIGSIMLMDTDLPGYQIALPVIFAVALFSAGLLVFALGLVLKARRQVVVTGVQHLLGATAEVERVTNQQPLVRLDGELWQVQTAEPLVAGDQVLVEAIDGITLVVRKRES